MRGLALEKLWRHAAVAEVQRTLELQRSATRDEEVPPLPRSRSGAMDAPLQRGQAKMLFGHYPLRIWAPRCSRLLMMQEARRESGRGAWCALLLLAEEPGSSPGLSGGARG